MAAMPPAVSDFLENGDLSSIITGIESGAGFAASMKDLSFCLGSERYSLDDAPLAPLGDYKMLELKTMIAQEKNKSLLADSKKLQEKLNKEREEAIKN